MKNLLFVIGFCIASVSMLFAQQDSLVLFNGKVVNGSDPLYNVHVYNHTRGTGTVTDFSGVFNLWVKPADTISMSSVGYKSISYVVSDTISTAQFRVLVNMIADTVLFRETVIMPWPANRIMLREAMLDQEKETELVVAFSGFHKSDKPVEVPKPKLSNPISFIYNAFSKKARQLKKIEKWRQENDAYDKKLENVDENGTKY